jgi:hypothetical protein
MGLVIVLCLMTVGFIIAILWAVIDWGALIRRKLANDIKKGRIYNEIGEDLKPIDAKRVKLIGKGELYEYKEGKKTMTLLVPNDFPVKFVNGRRTLPMKDGHLTVSYLHGEAPAKDTGLDLLIDVYISGICTDLIYTLTAKKGIPWWVWAILGVGAIVAIAFFLNRSPAEVIPGAAPGAESLGPALDNLPPGGY